jgi:hypothetical protein
MLAPLHFNVNVLYIYNIYIYHADRGAYAGATTAWAGNNCDTALCPAGVDPEATAGYELDEEVQQIHCRDADAGSFRLTFRGEQTDLIPFSVDADGLKTYIEAMST